MRIGVDASCLEGPLTGVGTYLQLLLEELVLHKEHTFFLYARKAFPYFQNLPHVHHRLSSSFGFSQALWSQTTLSALSFRDRLDLFWGPTQSLPLFARATQKNLLTVHDFAFTLFPQTVSLVRRTYLRLFFKHILNKADTILPISHGTAAWLEKLYRKKSDAIVNPPLKKHLRAYSEQETASTLKKYGLTYKQFVLLVGTDEPRKNFERVFQIYEKEQNLLPLVLAGQSKRARHALGYVPDHELVHLLAAARYLLMPSLYEGYGMPLAEARLSGTEVICTDSPEMREAAQEEAHLLSQHHLERDLMPFLKKAPYQKKFLCPTYETNSALANKLALCVKVTYN